ncbi:MAG TPA: hypothetical protein VN843_33020 [Anaerolineales bacterium]|nr:hypothetical protein [Anaerolineales bacterium]
MDNSFREQGSAAQQDSKRFLLVNLPVITSIIERLAGLIKLTAEEQEEAGIYPDRLGDE